MKLIVTDSELNTQEYENTKDEGFSVSIANDSISIYFGSGDRTGMSIGSHPRPAYVFIDFQRKLDV